MRASALPPKYVSAGVAGVVGRGHAVVGDKTMIDALEPAVSALTDAAASGASAADAARAAAEAAAAKLFCTEMAGRVADRGVRVGLAVAPGEILALIGVA